MERAEQGAKPEKIRFEYRPMTLDATDMERFRQCFEDNGSPRTMERLSWQYARNPTGKIYVDFAIDPAQPELIAGIYAVQPARMRVGATLRLGVQSVDTLVDARYRGQGLFVKMARAVYARCERENVALVYGFPNGNSAHGFFERLSWEPLDPVPFLVRPLNTGYATDRLLRSQPWSRWIPRWSLPIVPATLLSPGWRIEPLHTFDERTDRVWREFSRGIELSVERDAVYLNWRFRDHYSKAYTQLALYDGDSLLGFVVYAVLGKHGGSVAYIMELQHERWRTDVGRALLEAALRGARDAGADVVLSWCLPHSPNRGVYRSQGFVDLPQRFWPIELHVGARGFSVPAWMDLSDPARWYLSYSDSDTV